MERERRREGQTGVMCSIQLSVRASVSTGLSPRAFMLSQTAGGVDGGELLTLTSPRYCIEISALPATPFPKGTATPSATQRGVAMQNGPDAFFPTQGV